MGRRPRNNHGSKPHPVRHKRCARAAAVIACTAVTSPPHSRAVGARHRRWPWQGVGCVRMHTIMRGAPWTLVVQPTAASLDATTSRQTGYVAEPSVRPRRPAWKTCRFRTDDGAQNRGQEDKEQGGWFPVWRWHWAQPSSRNTAPWADRSGTGRWPIWPRVIPGSLDFDGSVLSTTRKAQGAAVGFHKKKKGARMNIFLATNSGSSTTRSWDRRLAARSERSD